MNAGLIIGSLGLGLGISGCVGAGYALGLARACVKVTSRAAEAQVRLSSALQIVGMRIHSATSVEQVQREWEAFTRELAEYDGKEPT